MPEIPELEVVREVLGHRVGGRTIRAVEVLPPGGPIVVRDLAGAGFAAALTGRTVRSIGRTGKFILFATDSPTTWLVVNPKLAGRFQLAPVGTRRIARTHFVLVFDPDTELRYIDAKTMGQAYLVERPDAVEEIRSMGPDALAVDRARFRRDITAFRGEIKGILTRGEFVSGIGNAYADEILWNARINPYRRRTELDPAAIERLFDAIGETLDRATVAVRAAMGEAIHTKPRDFLSVHMKSGEPCPRCATAISLVGANQRITNFCRQCQPGGLVKGIPRT